MFRALLCLSSGIVTPIGGRPVHSLRQDSLNLCTGRPPTECDDTRCCIIQFWPLMTSKRMPETCRGTYYKTRISAWSWFNYWDKYTEMQHGQRNIKIYQGTSNEMGQLQGTVILETYFIRICVINYRGVDKSLARPGRKKATPPALHVSFLMSFCISVCPHVSARLPMDGFLWNLVLETIKKICWKKKSNSSKNRTKTSCTLTLWYRNYFFLILAHLYIKCE